MKHFITANHPMHAQFDALARHQAQHFSYGFDTGVATLTLNRPERKNPLTFESYAELRNLFRALNTATDVKAVVLTGAGGNFFSGGDVHEIIGPLTAMSMPQLIGQGRASELLFTGRSMGAQEGLDWGFFNALLAPDELLGHAQKLAHELASGPTFAHAMTKTMLHQEWAMPLDQAIEAEAQAQAICMQTQDFKRAFEALANKQKPVFKGD